MMILLKELLSNSEVISSNRIITITVFVFMLIIMMISVFYKIDIDILKVILEYSLYLFVSSISLKSVEKVTNYFKTNDREDKTNN